MLRHQSPNFDRTSFLSGPSEMAGRIRGFDWSGHPLGTPEEWPSALRSALGIALDSAFPTCIYWGSELRLLYNDAWSSIPGPRHPGCLGEPAAEVWSDIWHIIEPQFTQAISSGQGVYLRDQMLPMRRFGVEEETYWTYNFTPIRLDDGSIGGIFNSGQETTADVLQRGKAHLLLELSDLFRTAPPMEELRDRALSLLGEHLGADRVGMRSGEGFPVIALWCAPDVETLGDQAASAPIDARIWHALLDGHVMKLDGTDPARAETERAVLHQLGVTSALALPWLDEGRTEAVIFVHSMRPRHWTDIEIQTVDDVLARLMTLLERARAAERQRLMNREINHRSRNLLSVVLAMVRLARIEAPEMMRAKLMERISALSRNNALLSDHSWEPVTLNQLLDQELGPYLGNEVNVSLDGPEVVLSSDASQAMGMVLHELVTNAAKHGALKEAGGQLDVRWALLDGARLRIDWTETCPFPVGGDGLEDAGFGSRLLHLMVERQMNGSLAMDLTPTGLACVIDMPWTDGRDEAE